MKRLDYLNMRAEDSALWNDPAEAQKLMRERQGLDDSISAIEGPDAARSTTISG